MPEFRREDYSRKQTLDLETAMADAVATLLEQAVFPGPLGQGTIQLAQVFREWPTYEDSQLSPSACVTPATLVYADAQPTPALIDGTWEPAGEPGFGLYVLCEATQSTVVTFRAGTSSERNALKAGVEQLFVLPDGSALPGPARYGVVLTMPGYYGLPARVSLSESLKLDDADSAITNANQFQVVLSAQARQVRLGRVQPFVLRAVTKVC